MNVSDCWGLAYKQIAEGNEKKAMEICCGEPCPEVLECQKYLGLTYYKQADMQNAELWYSRAAEQEDADALYGIACVRFTQLRFDEALYFFEHASNNGNARASHWIGFMYQKGYGTDENIDIAANYYRESVKHGYLIGEHALVRLAFQKRKLLQTVRTIPHLISLIFRVAVIAHKNADDECMADFFSLGKMINSSKK